MTISGSVLSRFGGIPRKESVTITSRASPDSQIDLKRSLDALAHAIGPLYDNLTMEATVGAAVKEKMGNVMRPSPLVYFSFFRSIYITIF